MRFSYNSNNVLLAAATIIGRCILNLMMIISTTHHHNIVVESFSPSSLLLTRVSTATRSTPTLITTSRSTTFGGGGGGGGSGSDSVLLYYRPEHDSPQEQQPEEQEKEETILEFASPVLQKLYPSLLSYKERYGHPNIPLGTKEGRACDTIRRLHIQNKLQDKPDIEFLNNIGFRFHSLEDVYKYSDFDDLFTRLINYENEYHTNYQIPKKYKLDPELGAWVTGIRRLSKVENGLDPKHVERLNSISFSWISTRKCGSKFMLQYRELQTLLEEDNTRSVDDIINDDPKIKLWIHAQQEASKRGTLSETRTHYMNDMFGTSWLTTDY